MTTVRIDNRGLDPPEPLQRTLAALRGLADADELVALMDREPLLLFPELVRRGYEWSFGRAPDGDCYVIRITRQAQREGEATAAAEEPGDP